jgi:hypothetical protein
VLPFQMDVVVYNSAGEAVRHLYHGASEGLPGGFKAAGQFIQVPGGAATLNFSGRLQDGSSTLLWLGDNDLGQTVSGGAYSIKVEQKDTFGATQSWTVPVSVVPAAQRQSLDIYNSAGELVVHLLPSAMGVPAPMADFVVSGAGGAFVVSDAPSGGEGVKLSIRDTLGGQTNYVWDGRNSLGQTVASGSYTIVMVSQVPGRSAVVATHDFVVLKDPRGGPVTVVAGPNPVGPKDKSLSVVCGVLPAGQSATATLYNLLGERLCAAALSPGSDRVVLDVGGYASGLYVVLFEVREAGGLRSRRLLRVAMER